MDEFTLKVIETGFTGFVVAGVGYFFAAQLESRKRRLSLLEEFSKRKIDAIIEVFAAASSYESKVQDFLPKLVKNELGSEKLSEHSASLKETYDLIRAKAHINRFIIGEDLYNSCVKYASLVLGRIDLVLAKDVDGLQETDTKIERLRKQIQDYLPS